MVTRGLRKNDDTACDTIAMSKCACIYHVVKIVNTAPCVGINFYAVQFFPCKGLDITATYEANLEVCQCTQYLLPFESLLVHSNVQ